MRKGRRAIQKPAISISSLISCAMQNPTPEPLAAALAALRSRERDFDLFRLLVKDFRLQLFDTVKRRVRKTGFRRQ
jgi:hypothetical protein